VGLRLAVLLGASVPLALVAGSRGAGHLGDSIGEELGRLAAPSPRRVKDIYGVPQGDVVADGHGHDVPQGQAPVAHPVPPPAVAAPSASVRTRGVYVPASVVMAYAKRGAVPASDGPGGVVLRGVGTGHGLADGDVVVRVGGASVRSLREISGIVTAAIFAGHTHVSGTVRRGDDEIAVTVEIPTGAPEPDGGAAKTQAN
jgi:hypothetical protein